jgi:carbohydrate diacid regulator
VLLLAEAMLQALMQMGASVADVNDVYRRALREEISGSELEALAHEHQIPMELERCVILFYIMQTGSGSAMSLLKEVMPQAEGDVLVEIDRHMVAMLKDMTTVDEVDDLKQFAEAVQETLMSETAHQTTVGIGEPRHNLSSLGESYREARRAIEVGRIFQADSSIYVFRRLMLERFLTELPRDVSLYYHSLLFNRKTARLFNDEMLFTIEMFFKKDLNLSDTARQLIFTETRWSTGLTKYSGRLVLIFGSSMTQSHSSF